MRSAIKPALIAVLILVAGVFVRGSIPQPPTGNWLSAGSMLEPRSGAASALLQDGRILITGGDGGSGPVANAEFFDTTGAFVAAPPMSMARRAHSATVLGDGRILVAGGLAGAAATNSAEIFDPASNTWSTIAGGMVQARSNHTATLLTDGRVLFAGGDNAGNAVASLEIFDPAAGSFFSAGVMSSPRMSFASALLADGRVLLIGGSNGTAPIASSEIFDPTTNAIAAGPALAAPRMSHSATTLLDGPVLVAGGSDGSGDVASAEIFSPVSGNFALAASSLVVPRRDHAAFLLPNNNSVLIVGGTSNTNELATAELYIPSTGSFIATGSPSEARQHASGAPLSQDGLLLLAGGSNSTGTLASSELYAFATVKTDATDYAPGTTVTITGSGWQPGETVSLTLVESPLHDTHGPFTAVADSSGNIVNTDFGPDLGDVGIRFYLTAVGQSSGLRAQTTFTDAVRLQISAFAITAPAGATDSTMNVSQSFTVQITIANNNNGPASDRAATWSALSAALTLPAGGWSKTADLSGGTLGSQTAGGTSACTNTTTTTSCTYSWTVTPPSTPSSGSMSVLVSATPSTGISSCSAGGANCSASASLSVSAVNPAALAISSFTANQTPGDTILKTGESAAVRLAAQNTVASPGASALGVSPSALTVNATGTASTTCGAGTPGANNISAGNTQNFNYTCGPVSGDGTLSFSGSANGSDQNSADALSTGAGTSNSITVDSTAPTVTVTPASGTYAAPFSFNWSITDPTVGGVSSGLNAATCNVKVDAVTVSTLCSGTQSVAGGSHIVVVTASDNAGNAGSAPRNYTISTDSIPPSVSVTFPAPPVGQAGYFNATQVPVVGSVSASDTSNVTAISCTDSAGGLVQGALSDGGTNNATRSLTVTGDGTHIISCTATDGAGNSGAASGSTNMATVKIDATPPANVVANADRLADHNGWYNHALTVTWSGADPTSGIASCTVTPFSGPDNATASLNGHCTDQAGNSSADVAFNFKFDSTPPTAVALSLTAGTPGANGWYTSDVTVHTAGAETVSGPPVCTADQFQTAETTGQSFNGSCTNDAGLTANATSLTIKLDKTGPTATLAVTSGAAGDNGWYTSDVTVHATGNDTISSPVSCGSDQIISTETTGTPVNGSCTNDAGLSTDASALTVKLDKTAPVVALAVTAGTAGSNGWYTSDVTVHTAGTDNISGIASCEADQFQTTETTGVPFNGSCKNGAGLTGNAAPLTVKLDKTGPTGVASAVTSGTLGTNGWYTSDVTVQTTGSDSISSPVICTPDHIQASETTGTDLHGSCTNDAGLTMQATALIVKLDKTPPSAMLSVTVGTPGSNGWYTSDVTVHASGLDSISSPVTCTPDQFQTSETMGAVFNGSCKNDAGLMADAVPLTVKLDKTGPSAALSVIGTLGNNNWYVSNVTITTAGSDSISNPTTCTPDQSQTTDTASATFNGSCTNSAGLSTSAAAVTIKRDATKPTLTPSVSPNPVTLNGSATSSAEASDNLSGIASQSCTALSLASVGTKTLNCTATDNAGNTNSAPVTYSVIYAVGGLCLGSPGHQILQPINADGSSVFNGKSTSPAKFRVCDANGVSIGTPGVVASFSIYQIIGGTITPPNEDVASTTPDTAFRWDPSAQQWIFNINNKSYPSNQTYFFRISLNDGTSIIFDYGLK
jgi:hypothetical protein